MIKTVNKLCSEYGDIRFQRANALVGEDATKGGFSIIVNGSKKYAMGERKKGKKENVSRESEKIQKILDDFLERTQIHVLCTEHARALLRDGDLFLNVIVDKKNGLITEVKRAPALTMKKNVNEYGNFIDIRKAFSQIDLSQIHQMAIENAPKESRKDFALYQINHIKWLADETKPYGTSQYAVAVKCYHMLSKMEEALAYRRIYRSVSKRSHKLETNNIAEIEEYKRANAMIDSNGNPTKNAHMLTDYIGNVEVSALHDEANLDEIKDVEMIENILWINLLVPKAIITGGQNINRDILKVQYPHYLQTLENITDRLEYGDSSDYSGYRAIINLQLLLLGINPDNVYYDIVWSRKTEETTAERVESIQNALGKNGGKQLISHEKAIQLIAEDFDVDDPAIMYQKIIEEKEQFIQNHTEQYENTQKKTVKILTDEIEEDNEKIEEVSKKFQKQWELFFIAVWHNMTKKQFTKQNVVSVFQNCWENTDKTFYSNMIKTAGTIGIERAQKILNDYTVLLPKNGIGIVKNDIYETLLHSSAQRIKGIEQTTINNIQKVLAKGYQNRESWDSIQKNIQTIIQDPVRAEMITTTELSFAYNKSVLNTYYKAGANKVVWHSSLDMKTCDGCRALHGQEFDIDKAPDNPLHPRCRCTWLPVFSEGKVANFDNSKNISYNNSEKQNTLKGKKREQNNEVYNIRIHKNVSEKEVEKEIEIVKETFAEMPKKVQEALKNGTIIDIGQEGKSQYNYNSDIMYIAKGADKKQVRHETGHMVDNKLMSQEKVEQLKREILGEVTIEDIYVDTTTFIDNLGNPVEVYYLENKALISEYQGRIYRCEGKIDAFHNNGEFKYEKMWDFMSEPYELYMRDKKELQKKCPKLYDYIKEVVE